MFVKYDRWNRRLGKESRIISETKLFIVFSGYKFRYQDSYFTEESLNEAIAGRKILRDTIEIKSSKVRKVYVKEGDWNEQN